ncbi:RHS repeat-associated core domain-containing protein [Pseudomonas hunanensis]|uniref:RHS repeat-associated core domain-containing protein n=1 Tax=Pseudomonas hunanensis TaxID=1247546 RepID=UPI00382AAFBD
MKRSQSYTPYGAIGGDGYCSVLNYNGDYLDDLVSGYHLGVGKRLYLPVLMRFASPDALSPFLKGGINSYSYCAGDPVNYSDPTGQAPVSPKPARKLSQGASAKPQQKITFKLTDDALYSKYLKMMREKIPPSEIMKANPELTPFVERHSKLTVLYRLRGGGQSKSNILPEDLKVYEYFKNLIPPRARANADSVTRWLLDAETNLSALDGPEIPELKMIIAWIRAEEDYF